MLPLDDPLWEELTHAHGSAAEIPRLLQQVTESPGPKVSYRDEPWFTLWSSLCHHGEANEVSFVAVPHLVEALARALHEERGPVAWDFFQLPAAIEIARARGRGELPEECALDYTRALDRLPALAISLHQPWEHEGAQAVCATLAAVRGEIDLAEAILELGRDATDRFLRREGLR
ncbi:MAG: hypothetical protein ACO4B3_03645 [Planctomycetota bacterium]